MRPIDADLLLKFHFLQGKFDRENGDPHYIYAWETFKEVVEGQPILKEIPDIERDGTVIQDTKWVLVVAGEYCTVCECPDCQEYVYVYEGYSFPNYCPNCGKEMVEEKDD